jgi:isocitrate/isopropylmalate dehydrogenase
MSGVMLLNYLAETRESTACRNAAQRIKASYDTVLAAGKVRTRDLGGTASTPEFAAAIIAGL